MWCSLCLLPVIASLLAALASPHRRSLCSSPAENALGIAAHDEHRRCHGRQIGEASTSSTAPRHSARQQVPLLLPHLPVVVSVSLALPAKNGRWHDAFQRTGIATNAATTTLKPGIPARGCRRLDPFSQASSLQTNVRTLPGPAVRAFQAPAYFRLASSTRTAGRCLQSSGGGKTASPTDPSARRTFTSSEETIVPRLRPGVTTYGGSSTFQPSARHTFCPASTGMAARCFVINPAASGTDGGSTLTSAHQRRTFFSPALTGTRWRVAPARRSSQHGQHDDDPSVSPAYPGVAGTNGIALHAGPASTGLTGGGTNLQPGCVCTSSTRRQQNGNDTTRGSTAYIS